MQNNYEHISNLLNNIKDDNKESLWELFDFYKPAIMSCIRKISKSYPTLDPNDLYSESVLIFKLLCSKYEPEKSNFSYYLNTRLHPYLIAKIKSNYLEDIQTTQLNEAECHAKQENAFEIIDIHYDIEMAMSKLTPKQRDIINDFYFNDINQVEIAKKHNMSQPAVSAQINKILKFLKKSLN